MIEGSFGSIAVEQGLGLPPPRGLCRWQVTPCFGLTPPPHLDLRPHSGGPVSGHFPSPSYQEGSWDAEG